MSFFDRLRRAPRVLSRATSTALGALGLVALGAVSACTSSSPTAGTTATTPASCRGTRTVATKDVPYLAVDGVDPNLLSLDYYVPVRPEGCGPAPIVVYVHGGGFRIGDKSNSIADKVQLFNDEGWVFASLNYRLSTSPPNDEPGQIRYPTHEQDVATALAWLKDHASTLGADPSRMLLMGHSSGAFIVSLISTDVSFLSGVGLSPDDIPCTASLDTEYDIARQVAQGGSQEILYRNAFGDDQAVWDEGSPVKHTAGDEVRPQFLIFTQGTARRTAQARDFGTALVNGGTSASVIDVSPLEHEEVNDAVGKPGDTEVTPALMDFFRTCAAGPG